MARAVTRQERARRYLQASMSAGYTGLPDEHREAYEAQMASHERAYPGVVEHALAGADQDFDKALEPGEREHQRHLRSEAGMGERDVQRVRKELRGGRGRGSSTRRAAARRRRPVTAGPRAARRAGRAGAGAITGFYSGRGGGNIVLQFVGMIMGLSLIYLLVAGKGLGAITGLTNVLVGGVRAFVAPVDPIASLESSLGAAPIGEGGSSPSSSSSPTSTGAAGPPAPGTLTPSSSAPTGKPAPAPNKIKLPPSATRSHMPNAGQLRGVLSLRKQLRDGQISPAQERAREETLIPRKRYPSYYSH